MTDAARVLLAAPARVAFDVERVRADFPLLAHSNLARMMSSAEANHRPRPRKSTSCLRKNSVRLKDRIFLMIRSTFKPVGK